jgi:hypothetical protein
MGDRTVAKATNSFIGGLNGTIEETAMFSLGFGYGVKVAGQASIAVGHTVEANGDYSAAFGGQTIASGYCQTVVGKYNAENKNSLFIVGNGYIDSNNNPIR